MCAYRETNSVGILIDNIYRIKLLSIKAACISNMAAELNKNLRFKVEKNCPWIRGWTLALHFRSYNLCPALHVPSVSVCHMLSTEQCALWHWFLEKYPNCRLSPKQLNYFLVIIFLRQTLKWSVFWRGLIKRHFIKEENFHKLFDKREMS